MTSPGSLLRFFRVVPPVPRLMVATFVAVTFVVVLLVALDPAHTATALTPIFLLQLFASSSGFASPARRGYYDLLMTRADGRLAIAVAHWITSVAPGVASCVVIAAAEWLAGGSATGVAFASGTAVTLFLLSTLPWAITAPLPRFAGAIGWLVVLAIARSIPGAHDGQWLWKGMETEPTWWDAPSILVYPLVLVGQPLDASHAIAVVPAVAVAVAAMAAVGVWIRGAEFPLEAAQ